MTQTVSKADLKKPAGNKQPQDGNGHELGDQDDDDVEEIETPEKSVDIIQLIHDDNKQVAELFFQFSQSDEDDEKQEIFDKIETGLRVHAQLVEELYYPLLPETAKEEEQEEAQKLVYEAEASNYVSSMILDVLVTMKPSDDYFDGKMAILHAIAKEQCKREEKDMFEKLKCAETEIDFDEIGTNAVERKIELEEELAPKGKRSKTRAKASSKSGGKKTKALAKKSSKASAKSSDKKKTAGKSKSSTKAKTSKSKTAASKSKTSAPKTKASVKAKSGAKSKPAGKAKSAAKAKVTAKSAKKTTAKATTKKVVTKPTAKKTTSKKAK